MPFTIYKVKDIIDKLILNIHHVQNTPLYLPLDSTKEQFEVRRFWVCYRRPEDSFESELVSHLPKPLASSGYMTDLLLTESIIQSCGEYFTQSSTASKLKAKRKTSKQHQVSVIGDATFSPEELKEILEFLNINLPQGFVTTGDSSLALLSELVEESPRVQDASDGTLEPPWVLGTNIGRPAPTEDSRPLLSPEVGLESSRVQDSSQEDIVPPGSQTIPHRIRLVPSGTRAAPHGDSLASPPPPGPSLEDDPEAPAVVGTVILSVALVDGKSVPKLQKGQVCVNIPDIWIQILFAVRAMLLVLIDSSQVLCRDPEGIPDFDYLGNLPASNVFSALDTMSTWPLGDFVSNIKYWKDFPLATQLRNSPPPKPSGWNGSQSSPLFSGELGDYWRRISHPPAPGLPDAPELFRAAFSITQAKKGCHPVPESFVMNAYKKHSITLSTPPTNAVADFPELLEFTQVLLRNWQPGNLFDLLPQKEGSRSASALFTRSMGGTRQEVRSEHLATGEDALVRMYQTDKGISSERGLLPPSLLEWMEVASRPLDFDYDQLPLADQKSIPEEWKSLPFCRVRGITEPLKVRVITAMPALSSHLSSPCQKSLWSHLSTFPQFALLKEPLNESHINTLLKQNFEMFDKINPDHGFSPLEEQYLHEDFVSGDYQAATDNLDIRATQIVLSVIKQVCLRSNDLNELLFQHFHAILDPQVLVYPKESGVRPVLQQNGQLMGSVLSFVILCIVNFWTYFRTLPQKLRGLILSGKFSLRKLPVLVNGDDILFMSGPERIDMWITSGKQIGFQLSVGKNYIHPNCVTINSLPIYINRHDYDFKPTTIVPLFDERKFKSWADLDEEFTRLGDQYSKFYGPRTFVPAPDVKVYGFLNVGLLVGLSKTSSGVRDSTFPLSSWFASATLGAFRPDLAANWFLYYHRNEIKRQTKFGSFTLNLFAHPLLGGLGFPIPPHFEVHYTESQRNLASRLLTGILSMQGEVIKARDNPLEALQYLGLSEKSPSLGNLPGRILFLLSSSVGPLNENESPYDPNFTIRSTPLSSNMDDIEADLVVMTRLSNSELHNILMTARRSELPKLAIASMDSFPYRLIRKNFDQVSETQKALLFHYILPEIEKRHTTPAIHLINHEEQVTNDPPVTPTTTPSDESWLEHEVKPKGKKKKQPLNIRLVRRDASPTPRQLQALEKKIQRANLGY